MFHSFMIPTQSEHPTSVPKLENKKKTSPQILICPTQSLSASTTTFQTSRKLLQNSFHHCETQRKSVRRMTITEPSNQHFPLPFLLLTNLRSFGVFLLLHQCAPWFFARASIAAVLQEKRTNSSLVFGVAKLQPPPCNPHCGKCPFGTN